MQVWVEVLIPHYRDPAGLKASLESLKRQTWNGRLVALVVDDGSPEDDWQAARTVCAESGLEVRLIRQAENLGRPRTRNRLLAEARAPWLAWLDSGDIWYSNKLAVQFSYLARLVRQGANPERLWVTCAYDWDQNGQRRAIRQQVGGDQLRELLRGDRLRAYLWTLLGSAQAFRAAGLFDERLPRLQDLDYFVNFVRGGGTIVTPPGGKPLCRYYKSDVGRNAVEVRDSNHLILDKLAPLTVRYGRAFQAGARFKAEMLAARFAANNGKRWMRLVCLMRAAWVSPSAMTRTIVRKVSR